jgi:hypothetical protein
MLKPRHYPRTEGFVPRNSGDLPRAHFERRAFTQAFTTALGPRPSQPRLVSSVDGALERVLFTIPRYAVESEPLAAAYRDLFAKLPAATERVVLTHAAVEGAVRGWLAGAPAAVVTVPDHLHFSIWAEDGYVVVRDAASGETWFVEPFAFPRYADGLIADFVSNGAGLKNTQAPLYFQGGNLLVGDGFFLIGADYPANTLEYVGPVLVPGSGETPERLIRRLYLEYLDPSRTLHYVGSTVPVPPEATRRITVDGQAWRETVYFGNQPGTAQPLFHIDMFLTLTGRGDGGRPRILVGSPRLAATALGMPLPGHSMQEVFDNIAAGLARSGFEVLRNPLPLVYLDDPGARERIWYFATANNALVEATDAARTVWLPTYGHGPWPELEATDQANARLWTELGFEVRLLGDFHPFAENLGAVHCIKKYLQRG